MTELLMPEQCCDMSIIDCPWLSGLNPEQLTAVTAPLDASLMVLAGAGTGKTHVMTLRFVHLLWQLRQQQPEAETPENALLAITFTNKAAQEMRERLISLCAQYPQLGVDNSTTLPVGTFHQWGFGVLRAWYTQSTGGQQTSPGGLDDASLGALSPDFQILDSVEQALVHERLLDQWQQNAMPPIPAWLNSPRQEAQTAWARWQSLATHKRRKLLESFPTLVGKVKQTGLAPQALYQHLRHQHHCFQDALCTVPLDPNAGLLGDEQDTSPERFYDTWANHWRAWQTPGWQQPAFSDEAMSTTHAAYWADVLDYKAPVLGDKDSLSGPLSPSRWFPRWNKRASKKAATRWTPGAIHSPAMLQETLAPLWALEHDLAPLFCAYYHQYLQALVAQNACDFDDALFRVLYHLHHDPLRRTALQARYRHVLVDECQDTNPIQVAVLQALRSPQSPGLTMVGDTKQAIYGFREANPDGLERGFGGRPFQRVALHDNYRSAPGIVGVANTMAEHIAQRLAEPVAWHTLSAQATPSEASLLSLPPDVRVIEVAAGAPELPDADEKTAPVSKGRPPALAVLRDAEASTLAKTLQVAFAQGDYTPQDVAILVRDHAKAAQLAKALTAQGMTVALDRDKAFFKQPSIQDAWALVTLLLQPANDMAWLRWLQKVCSPQELMALFPQRRPEKPTADTVPQTASQAASWTVWGRLQSVGEMHQFPALALATRLQLVRWVQTVQQHRPRIFREPVAPVLEALWDVFRDSGVAESQESPPELTSFFAGVAIIEQRLRQTTTQRVMTPALLLERLEQWRLRGDWPQQLDVVADMTDEPPEVVPVEADENTDVQAATPPHAIPILTLHASKGLEFPVVFLALCDSPRFRGSKAPLQLVLGDVEHTADNAPVNEPVNAPLKATRPAAQGFGLYLTRDIGTRPGGSLGKTLTHHLQQHLWEKPRWEAEEERLFYVGLTRAKRQLTIIRAASHFAWSSPEALGVVDAQVVQAAYPVPSSSSGF